MPFILSPEQKVVANALLSNGTTSTKYFDFATALQALCNGCTSALANQKKILICIADAEQKAMLRQMLHQIGLEDLTIDISEDNPIPEIDMIKLRSTLKKDLEVDPIIQHTLLSKKANVLNDKLSAFYEAFDRTVLADVPFRDFATKTIYNKASDRPTLNISETKNGILEFSTSEFYKTKKEIKQAVSLFKTSFELYDHLSLFDETIWDEINEEKIKDIKNQLSEIKKECEDLSKSFINVYDQLLNETTDDLNATFNSLEQQFAIHEEACMAYHIKISNESKKPDGLLSIFNKKNAGSSNKVFVEAFDQLSADIKKISSEWYTELDAPTAEIITYDYITAFLTTQREKAKTYHQQLTKNLEESVIRINKINTSSNEVKVLDERLNKLIERINKSNIFDLNIDHNVLSFAKQSDLVTNISEYLRKCHILLNSSSTYIQWKAFYNTASNIFKLIFNEIKRLPSSLWIDGFEKWYEHKLQIHILGNTTISSEELKSLYDISLQASLLNVPAVVAKLHKQRVAAAANIKKSNKELFNTLFKKKQTPVASWKNTALMNREFIQSFFPIHLSNSTAYAKEYDMVISFSREAQEDLRNIHYFLPIESSDIQNRGKKDNNFLYLNNYNYTGKLINLSSTDKLKASKKLAKYILSLNQNIRIYQLKNANVISLLPPYDGAYLEQELDKINAKVIDTQGVLYDRLTESILMTGRRPFLIVKNEMINEELYEHIVWQLKSLQLFEEAGYKILSLNTTNQFANNQKEFDKMIHEIAGSAQIEQSMRAQIDASKTIVEEV